MGANNNLVMINFLKNGKQCFSFIFLFYFLGTGVSEYKTMNSTVNYDLVSENKVRWISCTLNCYDVNNSLFLYDLDSTITHSIYLKRTTLMYDNDDYFNWLRDVFYKEISQFKDDGFLMGTPLWKINFDTEEYVRLDYHMANFPISDEKNSYFVYKNNYYIFDSLDFQKHGVQLTLTEHPIKVLKWKKDNNENDENDLIIDNSGVRLKYRE